MTGILRGFQYKKIFALVDHELLKDDQCWLALLANDPGNCSFPASINSAIRFSLDEFQTALGRKLAIHLSCLAKHIGAQIASNGKSRKIAVDPFGVNIAAAPGVPGDHFRITHDAFTTFVVNIAKENFVRMRGGGFGSVKGIFSKASTNPMFVLRTR
jgi:hypothetical protein